MKGWFEGGWFSCRLSRVRVRVRVRACPSRTRAVVDGGCVGMKVWDGRARNTIDAGVVCVSVRSQLAVGGSSALRPQSRTRGWEVGLDWGRGEGRILMLDSRRQSSVSRSSFQFRNERQKPSTWRGERERKKGKATVTERMVHAHLLQCDAATSVGACRVQPCNPAVVPGRSPPAPWWLRVRGTSYWTPVPGPGFVARMGEMVLTSSRGYLESKSLLQHRHPTRPQESSSGSAGRCAPVGGWELDKRWGTGGPGLFLPGSVSFFLVPFFLASLAARRAPSGRTDEAGAWKTRPTVEGVMMCKRQKSQPRKQLFWTWPGCLCQPQERWVRGN